MRPVLHEQQTKTALLLSARAGDTQMSGVGLSDVCGWVPSVLVWSRELGVSSLTSVNLRLSNHTLDGIINVVDLLLLNLNWSLNSSHNQTVSNTRNRKGSHHLDNPWILTLLRRP